MQKELSSREIQAEHYRRHGVFLFEAGRLESAVIALRYSLELKPDSSDAWNDMGVVMEALGNPHEAVRCYKQAIAVEPVQIEAQSNLQMLMLQLSMAQALSQTLTSSLAS